MVLHPAALPCGKSSSILSTGGCRPDREEYRTFGMESLVPAPTIEGNRLQDDSEKGNRTALQNLHLMRCQACLRFQLQAKVELGR